MVTTGTIEALQRLNADTLQRLQRVLEAMDQRTYTQVNPKGRASIGQHVRHTLEFYQCLLQARQSVNYDARQRDILMESSPDHALRTLREILAQLPYLVQDGPLQLEAEMPHADVPVAVPSSRSRELLYVLEHAIHHMALMRILIHDQAPHIPLEEEFGVAYSTLAFRGQLNT